VSRACDCVVLKVPVNKRASVVCANVIDGIKRTSYMKQGDHFSINFDKHFPGVCDVANIGGINEF
jgi:hypothetical protein